MRRITPCLWFDFGKAEEAANFYVSVFKDSKIISKSYYPKDAPGPEGSIMFITFQMNGQEFAALSGGPDFKFSESVSFMVNCETQEEIDYYWEKLSSDGGQEVECGWVRDKYGLLWQIVPSIISQLISGKDPVKADRVLKEVWKMKKIDIATLERAYGSKIS
jgi:predicted 3-demethylubiquinone-9 3-methyltransferase (glyoxalase superfamily)